MANFRIRVGLNRGRGAFGYRELSVLSEEVNSFLRSLGEDAGLSGDDNQWLAKDIADGSFLSDATPAFDVSDEHAALLESMTNAIVHGDEPRAIELGVRERTRFKYESLAKKAATTKIPVDVGLYGDSGTIEWVGVVPEVAHRLTENISPYLDYMGAVQGVIHVIFKESDPPHFKLRDSVTGDLVDCFYKPEHYASILRALHRKDDRVHVAGLVRASRIDKKIESLKVTRVESPGEFSDADFEAFFGCAPAMTGEIDSADFIERGRHDA